MREKRVTNGENGICHFKGGICQGKSLSSNKSLAPHKRFTIMFEVALIEDD